MEVTTIAFDQPYFYLADTTPPDDTAEEEFDFDFDYDPNDMYWELLREEQESNDK